MPKLSLAAQKNLSCPKFGGAAAPPHGPYAYASVDLVFTQKKKISLRLGESSLAMLLSPSSFDSQEPAPEAKDLVVTLEK